MIKFLFSLFLISSFELCFAQHDTVLIRQLNSILNTIKTIDSYANLVKKQKITWKRQSIKIKYYSATDKTIKHKIRLRNSHGNLLATHKLRWGYFIKVKMLTQNDIPVLIRRKDKVNNVITTFTYLGNSKWYFNDSSDNQAKKYFVTMDISHWR